MKLPIDPTKLYQAYPQTVGRDIAYGWARGFFGGVMMRSTADIVFCQSRVGKAMTFGLTVLIACIVSSPFNEWRGYSLQPADKKLPFAQFFKLDRYARSTGTGSIIMGVSLCMGNLLVPFAESLFAVMQEHYIMAAAIVVACVAGIGMIK